MRLLALSPAIPNTPSFQTDECHSHFISGVSTYSQSRATALVLQPLQPYLLKPCLTATAPAPTAALVHGAAAASAPPILLLLLK
jgi:hypothetical protein